MGNKRPDLPVARLLVHTHEAKRGEYQDTTCVSVRPGTIGVSVAEERNLRHISECVSFRVYDKIETTPAIRHCELAIDGLKAMIRKLRVRRDNLCLED